MPNREGKEGVITATLSHGPEAEENTRDSPFDSNCEATDSNRPNQSQEPPHRQSSPPPPPPSPPSSPSPPTTNLLLPTLGTVGDVPASHAADSMSVSHTSATTMSTSTASKHKWSALHASQSNTSGSKKQWTTTGAVALNSIKKSLNAFNATLGCSLAFQPECTCADTSPKHQAKAMDVLQELEDYLDDDHMVAFIDLSIADTAADDAYLAIKHESL